MERHNIFDSILDDEDDLVKQVDDTARIDVIKKELFKACRISDPIRFHVEGDKIIADGGKSLSTIQFSILGSNLSLPYGKEGVVDASILDKVYFKNCLFYIYQANTYQLPKFFNNLQSCYVQLNYFSSYFADPDRTIKMFADSLKNCKDCLFMEVTMTSESRYANNNTRYNNCDFGANSVKLPVLFDCSKLRGMKCKRLILDRQVKFNSAEIMPEFMMSDNSPDPIKTTKSIVKMIDYILANNSIPSICTQCFSAQHLMYFVKDSRNEYGYSFNVQSSTGKRFPKV